MRSLPRTVRQLSAGRRAAVERLSADPGGWLPSPARRRGPDRWDVALTAGPVARSIACGVGPAWRIGDDEVWRSLSWTPEAEFGDLVPLGGALPTFRGHIGIEPDGDGAAVVLTGAYAPPGSFIGAAADAAALHRVAEATARRFVDDVAAAVEARPITREAVGQPQALGRPRGPRRSGPSALPPL